MLDVRHGRYHALSGVGTRVWQLIESQTTIEAIAAAIVAEYPDATLDQVDSDVRALLTDLGEAGLLNLRGSEVTSSAASGVERRVNRDRHNVGDRNVSPVGRHSESVRATGGTAHGGARHNPTVHDEARGVRVGRIGPPSVLRCSAFILGAKIALRVVGFGRTLRWVHQRSDRRSFATSEPAPIERTAEAVGMAGALYPGRAMCLEQSLALYYYLRRLGVDAQLRLGVQPHPISAHAWIEVGDTLINDIGERVKHFIPLPAFAI